MSEVSFVISSSGKLKKGKDLSQKEMDSLFKLLTSPASRIAKSEVMVKFNNDNPVKLCDLDSYKIALLAISVGNFRMGKVNEIDFKFRKNELDLVIAMVQSNLNVCNAAKLMGVSRDKLRGELERFKNRWSFDLTNYIELCRAYAFAMNV